MADEDKKKETKKDETPKKTIAEQLDEISTKHRKALELMQEEDRKKLLELGRKDESRVQSTTRIAGLRGLEPRWGQQFADRGKELNQ